MRQYYKARQDAQRTDSAARGSEHCTPHAPQGMGACHSRALRADNAEKNALARELHAQKGSFWAHSAGGDGQSPVSGVGGGGQCGCRRPC